MTLTRNDLQSICSTLLDMAKESIENALELHDSTRVRETRTEPPMKDFANCRGYVLAWNPHSRRWLSNLTWEELTRRPDTYPYWLPMPADPEEPQQHAEELQ